MFSLQTLPTTQYELEIVAKDMAGSEVGLTGTATATIAITDRNDHAPEFTHSLVGQPDYFSLASFSYRMPINMERRIRQVSLVTGWRFSCLDEVLVLFS